MLEISILNTAPPGSQRRCDTEGLVLIPIREADETVKIFLFFLGGVSIAELYWECKCIRVQGFKGLGFRNAVAPRVDPVSRSFAGSGTDSLRKTCLRLSRIWGSVDTHRLHSSSFLGLPYRIIV